MLFSQESKHAAIRGRICLDPASARIAQEQNARGALLGGEEIGVIRCPREHGTGGFYRLLVLLVESAIHRECERAAVRDVLPQPQPYFGCCDCRKPPWILDELHAQINGHFVGLAIASAVHVVAGHIRPERQWPPLCRVRFVHDSIGVLPEDS